MSGAQRLFLSVFTAAMAITGLAATGESFVFVFREPALRQYQVEEVERTSRVTRSDATARRPEARGDWLRVRPGNGSAHYFELGSRIVLQLRAGTDLLSLLAGTGLRVDRTPAEQVFILQAESAVVAAREAQRLAQLPGVVTSVPVMRRPRKLQGPYARLPNDPYFHHQWYLENRRTDGSPAGADLNVRAAWPFSQGSDVIIAVGDDGIELSHPDLRAAAEDAPHFNFANGTTNGNPETIFSIHATAVAGLAGARGYNGRGISGVAPRARLASWVIFDTSDELVSDEALMDMFQYRSDIVGVQNHSWANADIFQFAPSLLEHIAISNAVFHGRAGKGVVIVRAAGNYRENGGNANDDGYPSDPRTIGVAAVRSDGRAASYSNPGACLLVAAPSGDIDHGFSSLFTTDRQGTFGYNQISFTNDFADYGFDAFGFSGTSASTPQIAGLAALMLAANTNLTVRDVQQILILSSRHLDLADPDLRTNGAGLLVSHNVGYGVPDAGRAVWLSRRWVTRPALTNVLVTATNALAVPNDSLRVILAGAPAGALQMASAAPSLGIHPSEPTATVDLIDVGLATNRLTLDLTNKAAFIRRGTNLFREKIQFAADAGALFAVLYNNRDGTDLVSMAETDFSPIPAVFISENDGEQIRELLLTNGPVRARIQTDPAKYFLPVTEMLSCEHVSLQLQTDHPARGDLRLELISPQGTRAVLQRVNADTNSTLSDWTYHSVHHFYESSAGTWTVAITDEGPYPTGEVKFVGLHITGTPIIDVDRDGLDDDWEIAELGSLAQGPAGDFDRDGYSNVREFIAQTNPRAADIPFQVDFSVMNQDLGRLSWPAIAQLSYEILAGTNSAAPLTLVATVPGKFPETEWFTPLTNLVHRFFRVRAIAQ